MAVGNHKRRSRDQRSARAIDVFDDLIIASPALRSHRTADVTAFRILEPHKRIFGEQFCVAFCLLQTIAT